MKKLFLLAPLIFIGCTFSNTPTKDFTKCYINKTPAPFWVCYQSPFVGVGKIYTKKFNRLKQEEAYSIAISELYLKLQTKTKLFLRKLDKENENIINKVKDFVILNAVLEDSWYNQNEYMLYVKVAVNKEEFKKFLFNELKDIDKKILETTFNETF